MPDASLCLHAGMVHTRYHFKVHSEALPGALARFGAMLSAPLIAQDRCAADVASHLRPMIEGCSTVVGSTQNHNSTPPLRARCAADVAS
jgi:hypothetical protein